MMKKAMQTKVKDKSNDSKEKKNVNDKNKDDKIKPTTGKNSKHTPKPISESKSKEKKLFSKEEENNLKENDFLKKKQTASETTKGTNSDKDKFESDSDEENILLRTGEVPKTWYNEYDHAGYDVNANKVIKPEKEDEVEKFIKRASDKNWWRNVFDDKNNKEIFLSKKDIELIKRIKSGQYANPQLHGDDYDFFEKTLEKEVFPLSNHQKGKKAFEESKSERKLINRIIDAYNNGFLKLFEEEEGEAKKKPDEILYDIWSTENTDIYTPGKGFSAPKKPLPDVEESYNPPDEVIHSLKEQKIKQETENIYGLEITEEEKIFEAKKFDSLRKIPVYKDLFAENFYRLCDLFMSARLIIKKKDIKEEDILPKLPKPEELKPFPSMESIIYRGHGSSVKALCIDDEGKFIISGDSAGFVMFWDIDTTKIIKRIHITYEDEIVQICLNPVLNLLTVICKNGVYFLLPPYLNRKTKSEVSNLLESKV